MFDGYVLVMCFEFNSEGKNMVALFNSYARRTLSIFNSQFHLRRLQLHLPDLETA